MAKISDLSDELLVKILSFLETKVAVSTSILSKQWEFLWMWLPKLEFDFAGGSEAEFFYKNLPLHRAPIIESLSLSFRRGSFQPERFKSCARIAVSRCVRELSISSSTEEHVLLPSSLYICNSLVTLKLEGCKILVDVPRTVCLPSLKTLQLQNVTYSNDDSLRLLLSYCPVLEDLSIDREWEEDDNVRKIVIIVPSLQRLSLYIDQCCSDDGYVIVTPSLKYFEVEDNRCEYSYLIEPMPELEEASIMVMADVEKDIEKLLKSVTAAKRLSIYITFNSGEKVVYRNDIVFSRLENLKLYICSENWSILLFQLLKDSPKLKILDLIVEITNEPYGKYDPVSSSSNGSFVPKCLLKSLETFQLKGYSGEEPEERDFLSFIFKHACCLKSISLLP